MLLSYPMKTSLISFVSLVWLASNAASGEADRSKVLPPGAAFACHQSVDDFGDRDRKPFSIHWESYSVRQDVLTIAEFTKTHSAAPLIPSAMALSRGNALTD